MPDKLVTDATKTHPSHIFMFASRIAILQKIRHSYESHTSLRQTLRQRERKLALSSNFLFPFTSNSYIINEWDGGQRGYSTNLIHKKARNVETSSLLSREKKMHIHVSLHVSTLQYCT
jgi:hypothetical protein